MADRNLDEVAPTPNEAAIRRWSSMPREAIEAYDDEGDFAKRHLLNPVLRRLLHPVAGRRILDAGCGEGYLSRMLARQGAEVVAVEPATALLGRARELESTRRQGIRYVQADLAGPLDLGEAFDAVVASMVLSGIPEWRPAMRNCVAALRPGGLFVFTVNHPCFEQLWGTWNADGAYRTTRYLAEYEIAGPHASDFHRPLSAYLNEVAQLGCRVTEIAEPGLDPTVAAEADIAGIDAYVHLPNFLVVAATREHR